MHSEKLEFPNHGGETLAGRIQWPDEKPRAFALFAHCFTCSKDIAAAGRIARGLSRRGYAVLRFDFTGLGNSDGDFANTNFSSNVDDLVAAAEFLGERYEAPALLVGHSLGGAAVLTAGTRLASVRAIATIGAPSDPRHVRHLFEGHVPHIERDGSAEVELAGRRFRIAKQFLEDLEGQRMEELLRDLDAAVLIMHSPVDRLVDVDHARRLYWALPHPKSFVSLDDADHLLTRPEHSEYAAEVLSAWASRYVRDGRDAAAPADHGVVHVRGTGREFTQRITAGRHEFVGDEPEDVGGGDTGPTPYDFLLAALGSCTSMTIGMYARRKGITLDAVEVVLRHHRVHAEDCGDCESAEGRVDVIEREIVVHGDLDGSQRARLLEIADRCPVHRTLENEIRIRTRDGAPQGEA